MRSTFLFTSESVSEGHPDKVSDQISDAVVDLLLSKDPEARVACETLTTTQRVVLAGELRCKGVYEDGAWVDGALEEIERVVRETVRERGLIGLTSGLSVRVPRLFLSQAIQFTLVDQFKRLLQNC